MSDNPPSPNSMSQAQSNSDSAVSSFNQGSVDGEIDSDEQAKFSGAYRPAENAVENNVSTPADHPRVSNSDPSDQQRHIAQQIMDLLEEMETMLQALSTSPLAARADQSTRARFWNLYRAEAEEFHTDFLDKHKSDMDNSLVFVNGIDCLQVDPTECRRHMQNCIDLASFLPGLDWWGTEALMLQICLGRESGDYRPWKQTCPDPVFLPDANYPNTYVRDVWFRIVQIVAKFVQAESVQSFMRYRSDSMDLTHMFILANVPWWIYNTHPLPDEMLFTTIRLLAEVMSDWEESASDKEGYTEDLFKYVSQVVRPDDSPSLPRPANKAPWFLVLKVLRPHIREHVRLEYPLIEEEMRVCDMESEGKDNLGATATSPMSRNTARQSGARVLKH